MTSLTTIDVVNQARDYLSEFYRMRRCLLPNVETPFFFSSASDNPIKEVLLVGDFTNWTQNPIPMMKKKDHYHSTVHLQEGSYHYKYSSYFM